MEANNPLPAVSQEALWYLNNYILLRDYYDRTISRIAARCVRKGNIAIEEYPYYGYILDVLEEICEVGEYILKHRELYPYVEKKIAGGFSGFRKNLAEYNEELKKNASPDMIKDDGADLKKMKEALGAITKEQDPTIGAGMSMDEVIEKLMAKQNLEAVEGSSLALSKEQQKPVENSAPPASQPQPQAVKKLVKIIKPVAPQNPQAVPDKVEE